MARYSKLGIQILGLLSTGLLLGYARGKRNRKELFDECDKIWHAIDRNQLFDILDKLKMMRLVEVIKKSDGEKIIITPYGKNRAKQNLIRELKIIRQKRWDRKWRIIIFDVPENKRKLRDSFRRHLKRLGFYEFQKSVFVIPYPCEDEIATIVNLIGLKDNVRYLESQISYDAELRKEFSL